jgi:hypothetical protein
MAAQLRGEGPDAFFRVRMGADGSAAVDVTSDGRAWTQVGVLAAREEAVLYLTTRRIPDELLPEVPVSGKGRPS